MRILVDGMPQSIGGIGTLLLNIAQYNASVGNSEKYRFEFLIPKNSEYKDVLLKNKYKYFEVPRVCTVAYKKVLKTIFNSTRYNYVWINNTSKVNIVLPQLAKKNNTKVISHSHGVSTEASGIKKAAFGVLEMIYGKRYCRLIDIPFACSESSAKYFYPKYLLSKCQVIHNGIIVDKFLFHEEKRDYFRNEQQFGQNDILIGSVGRLTKVKNYSFLISVMYKLPYNYKLIIIGDGEEREVLEKQINEFQLNNKVFLLGKKDNVEDYLSAMDIFAMPSLNEGLPFALVEAQASGLKCIVSNGVSKESDLTGQIAFADIVNEIEWIDIFLEHLDNNKRENSAELIKKKGYSIEESYVTLIESLDELKDIK